MQIVSYIVIGVWLISAVILTITILMHSGRGTGVSEVLSGMNNTGGTSIIEKNLDRITTISAVIFMVCLVLMMNFDLFPLGTVNR